MSLDPDFVNTYANKEVPWGFGGLGYVVFKRTYARPLDGRSEEWHETVERVVNGAIDIGAGLTDEEAERLFDYMFNLKGAVSGRGLWQLGTENNDRLGGDSLVNCWWVTIRDTDDFGWLFDRLMLGGGVGLSVRHSADLGVVRDIDYIVHEEGAHDSDFIVPDKREGWRDLVVKVLDAYLKDGESFTYSTALVRPEGAPIKTFGGTASGPGILVEGVAKIQEVLVAAGGRHLTSVEVLDIANIIGSIVVSGNVRRSAQIALGDPTDLDFLEAKRWDLGGVPAWRAMSNNSVFCDDPSALPVAFWEGYAGKGEPYGLVNLKAARKYARTGEVDWDPSIEGFNPCAEIPLANRESCNLAEVFLPRIEGPGELKDLALLLYKVQKAVAALPYLDPQSDDITSSNLRLGLGVTGIAQADEDALSWLDETYRELRSFDIHWSRQRGLPESVRLTTVKPSGTLSLLAGVTPGVHPGFSRFHIRRVRMSASDPVFTYCQEKGYAWEFQRDFDGTEDPRTAVVEFPCEFPEGTLTAEGVSALDLLDLQARLQAEWADNAVSVTIYFRPEELDDIRAYLAEHWSRIKSVSFLPLKDHGFDQAPLQGITREEYLDRLGTINSKRVAVGAGKSELLGADCEGGACPIR